MKDLVNDYLNKLDNDIDYFKIYPCRYVNLKNI